MSKKDLAIGFDRGRDYFGFLKFHSEKTLVLYIERDNNILGMGAFIFRDGRINSEQVSLGYSGDLRVKFDRRAAVLWRRFYSDFLKNIHRFEEYSHCKYFLTAIMNGNNKATQALVNNARSSYSYEHQADFNMVNIFLKKPFKRRQNTEMKALRARDEDKDLIMNFLEREHKKKKFGFCFNSNYNELEYRLKNWEGFSMEDFVIVKKNNLIVGVTAPWSPSPHKKIILKELNFFQRNLIRFLALFINIPREGEEFLVQYLTLLTIENDLPVEEKKKALNLMVTDVSERAEHKKYHALCYLDFCTEAPLVSGLNDFFLSKIKFNLYQASDKDFIAGSDKNKNIAFEIALA